MEVYIIRFLLSFFSPITLVLKGSRNGQDGREGWEEAESLAVDVKKGHRCIIQ
jgi:hypothetical protein